MTEQQPTTGDDVEGHGFKRAFAEDEQVGDDVEGHRLRWMYADEQPGEGAQQFKGRTFAESDDTDDVAGHLSGALGTQKRDDGH